MLNFLRGLCEEKLVLLTKAAEYKFNYIYTQTKNYKFGQERYKTTGAQNSRQT
ncbi:MAG: hypothetical protein HDT10_07265 [Helicobacter sp.]|nr:hypothetical protein [Helicobacter sp.]